MSFFLKQLKTAWMVVSCQLVNFASLSTSQEKLLVNFVEFNKSVKIIGSPGTRCFVLFLSM